MAKLYYNLIVNGKWTIERVPEKWRGEVKELLSGETAETE